MKRWQKNVLIGTAGLAVLAGVAYKVIDPASLISRQQEKNDQLIAEEMAYHVGTMAYLYGYPIVDMLTQMHNETHLVEADQPVYAPVNAFFRFEGLVTPNNSGNFRAPNSDTLYFTAWYDLRQGPVVLSTPDTKGRYFTIAVTNLYAEVSHIGRRTTGTTAQRFALTTPNWQGELPEGVIPHPVESDRGWLLGRMYVGGPEDLQAAEALVAGFDLIPLSEWPAASAPWSRPTTPEDAPLAPHSSLAFFATLDEALQHLPPRQSEQALLDQFRQIGVGTGTFAQDNISSATRRGLERALEDGQALVQAATRRTIDSYNGWMISMDIGRYGFKYLHRAAVARGGYGNHPEESLYPATVFDANGDLMTGDRRYRITFSADKLPPTHGFWSISAYDLFTMRMVENGIQRYAIGDRTEGLQFSADGSLTLYLQHDQPEQGISNWLPIPEGRFLLVMRLYEPNAKALTHEWLPPKIEILE